MKIKILLLQVCALFFLSSCTFYRPPNDRYSAFQDHQPEAEACVLKTDGKVTIRRDVKKVFSMRIVEIDGQKLRHAWLIRRKDAAPPFNTNQFERTGDNQIHVYTALLPPGKHQIVVDSRSEYPPLGFYTSEEDYYQDLYDHIRIKHWHCEAGKTYRLSISGDEAPGHWENRRIWIEDDQKVIWENWKPRSTHIITFH